MNKNTRARITTIAAATAVLAVFGGGSAVAGSLVTSAKIKDGTIRSVDVKNGTLRSVDLLDNSVGSADIRNNTITGADVADGSLSNADISVYHVSVKSTGAVSASSGGINVERISEGAYRVFLPRNVQTCSVAVTPASPETPFAPQANLGTADVLNHPEAFVVAARNMNDSNDPIDVGFHAVVVC